MTPPADTATHRDGNVLAGLLFEVFDVDLTGALRSCPHCGLLGALAQPHVYGRLPGLVACCPACSAVALRLARHPGALWREFSGTGAVRDPLDGG
ncbi:DUF6510 family protein [Streptomyces albidoflavus]